MRFIVIGRNQPTNETKIFHRGNAFIFSHEVCKIPINRTKIAPWLHRNLLVLKLKIRRFHENQKISMEMRGILFNYSPELDKKVDDFWILWFHWFWIRDKVKEILDHKFEITEKTKTRPLLLAENLKQSSVWSSNNMSDWKHKNNKTTEITMR